MFPYLQISKKYFTIWGNCLSDQCIYSLCPVDLIWSLWPWSSLVQVKVCILTSDCVNVALSKVKVQWNLNKDTIIWGHLNLLSAKWWPFCSGLIVMIILVWLLYSCLRIIVKKPILRIHITHTHTHIYIYAYIYAAKYILMSLCQIYIYIYRCIPSEKLAQDREVIFCCTLTCVTGWSVVAMAMKADEVAPS